jgi:glycosyltransferase involved in cell wall biosynthesis
MSEKEKTLIVPPLRIGIISIMQTPWGGSEELWAATAGEALKAGHEVFVSVCRQTNEAPKIGELERRGAKVLRRRPDSGTQAPPASAASRYRDLFKTNPDAIAISQGATFDFIGSKELLELLYVSPIPYVLICHFNEPLPLLTNPYHRENARKIFARAFRVLFVANRNRIEAERQLAAKIPNADLVLNPVNLSDRSYLPWPESKTARFASVARLDAWYKGQDILIEALSADPWRHRDWHLTIYGAGRDEGYLRSLVEFFALQGRITFAGHRSDVRAIWAREQVLVMFSRGEGTPLALVEAMLCGRPAIVSDVGGNREWVTDAQTGFVAEAPLVELARATLERAWSARQHWNTMGVQAHKSATVRIGDPSIPGLLDVLSEASRLKRHAATATSEGRERLKQYRTLIEPSIPKRVAETGEVCAKGLLNGLRRAHTKLHEQCLLRLERVRNVEAASQAEIQNESGRERGTGSNSSYRRQMAGDQ